MNKPHFALVILLSVSIVAISCCPLSAQKKINSYFLVIGSGNYAADTLAEGATGFPSLNSPGYSAHLMDSVFSRYHFNKGISLISTDTTAISKKQIDSALSELISTAKKDQETQGKQCVFIIYYAGHGIKHPQAFDLFLVPGYFPNNIKYTMVGSMREVCHSVLSVYYKLKWATKSPEPWEDFRIVMLMDCCYNSDHDALIPLSYPQSGPDAFYSQMWVPPMEIELGRHRKKKNKDPQLQYDDELGRFYREDGAYFAASNGEYAQTVPSPFPGDHRTVAPICRKTLLFLREKELDLDLYINSLTDPVFDAPFTPVTYFHKPESSFALKVPVK